MFLCWFKHLKNFADMMSWNITTEEFIRIAKSIHGDKYCYDRVDYENKDTKVEIICPIHGSFWQKPFLHIKPSFKCGCPKCASESTANLNRLDTNIILNRIKEKFGQFYDLSLVKFGKTVHDPITIVCPIHGKFEIKPWYISLRKNLCLECKKDADIKKRSNEFLVRAKKIHGDKFDYSKVSYKNANTPVEIICHKHGSFYQRPGDHLSGKGCEKCYRESRKFTKEDFLKRAKVLWGNRWDYTKSTVNSTSSKITITCKKHGDFIQSVHTHLSGYVGCEKCQREYGYFKTPRTAEEFIKAAKKVHGNKFDYSLVKGICSLNTTVNIICKKHGIFEQKVKNHLQGHGCRKCRNAQQEKIVSLALLKYNIEYEREKMFKWLKRKGYLKLDFYLPEYNIAIEAQGAMHFGIHKNNKYTMTKEDYEDLFERDRVKYKLCKEHGIRILYFCYNKEWVPDNYIDHVYTTVKELLAELERIKNL